MYGYWTPPESVAGRTLLCVTQDRDDLSWSAGFGARAGAIDAPEPEQ
jgi:hypothetical protein